MKLTFKYKLQKISKKNNEMLDELMWHATKAYNMCLYDIREGIEKINEANNLNIISTQIYRRYRKENYNPKRRVYRGLFITNKGKKINADINGSLNILRRYVKSKTNLEIAMNNGREQRPIKKRVA